MTRKDRTRRDKSSGSVFFNPQEQPECHPREQFIEVHPTKLPHEETLESIMGPGPISGTISLSHPLIMACTARVRASPNLKEKKMNVIFPYDPMWHIQTDSSESAFIFPQNIKGLSPDGISSLW